MAVSVQTISDRMESWFPTELAEDWDNVGWMVEPSERTIETVLLGVDPSLDIINHGISIEADLVLTHHPLILEPVSKLVSDRPTPRKLLRAVRNQLGIYSAHTNADSAPGGLNDYWVEKLNLGEVEPLRPDDSDPGAGLGRIGVLEGTETVRSLEDQLSDIVSPRHVWSTVSSEHPVEKVGVCTGSGGDFLELAGDHGVDLYITGDVGHHIALDAREMGVPLLVLDHYEMETVFVELMSERLQSEFGSELTVEQFIRDYPYRHRWFSEPERDEE